MVHLIRQTHTWQLARKDYLDIQPRPRRGSRKWASWQPRRWCRHRRKPYLGPAYCHPVRIRPADSKQTRILFPHPLPLEREGSQAWRRCHLQQQGCDASPSESTSDGDSEPPDAEIQPDDEGRAGMGMLRLSRLRRRLQILTGIHRQTVGAKLSYRNMLQFVTSTYSSI